VIRSDGIEYELTYSPTDRLQLIFNATDDFARIIAVPSGYLYFLGATPVYAARYESNLWAKYKVTRGFWIAGGYKYSSSFDAISATRYLIYPATMEYDAAIGYGWKGSHNLDYELTLNGMNLSNALIVEAQGSIPLPRRFVGGFTVKY